MADRIEGRNAVLGADIDGAGIRIDGDGIGDADAVAAENLAGERIELQQRAAGGGGPEIAEFVERHGDDGFGQRDQQGGCLRAAGRHQIQRAAIGAAGNQEGAIWQLHDRLRPDAGLALRNATGEAGADERRQHRCEGGRIGGGGNARHILLGRGEQRVGRRCHHRCRRLAEVRRCRCGHLRGGADIDAGAVARHLGGGGFRLFLIAGVVGGQCEELIGVSSTARVDEAAGRLGQMALPDRVVAAVGGDVKRDMGEAGAAGIVG